MHYTKPPPLPRREAPSLDAATSAVARGVSMSVRQWDAPARRPTPPPGKLGSAKGTRLAQALRRTAIRSRCALLAAAFRPIGGRALLNGGFDRDEGLPRVVLRSTVPAYTVVPLRSRADRLRYVGLDVEGNPVGG